MVLHLLSSLLIRGLSILTLRDDGVDGIAECFWLSDTSILGEVVEVCKSRFSCL